MVTLANSMFVLHGDVNLQYFVEHFNQNVEKLKPSTHQPIFYPLEAQKKPSEKRTIPFDHLSQTTILMISFKIDNPTEEETTLL